MGYREFKEEHKLAEFAKNNPRQFAVMVKEIAIMRLQIELHTRDVLEAYAKAQEANKSKEGVKDESKTDNK